MNGEQIDDNQPEKKNKAAITGFILAVLFFLTSLTGFFGVIFFITISIYKDSLILFLLICLLIAAPGLVFSFFGLRRKKGKIFAWMALSLSFFCVFIFIPFRHITFLPPGSLPRALEIYKFHKACPYGSFWLNYDKANISNVLCQNTGILVSFGAINFKAKQDSYHEEDVIRFAEQNGWKYHLKVSLATEDFVKFSKRNFTEDELVPPIIFSLDDYCYVPLWIEQDCNVMAFETPKCNGLPSYVIITKDGSKMDIRYGNPILPDGPHGFILANEFYELSEIQQKKQFPK